ncbi:hypothetical protein Csa_003764 [Cucumis sativus]|uniref:Uncharacterized protein n=1 Tax=Cucumis sativus TaxID=3659 RepID=A0A0A0KHN5_CUCSA|nr:hypothetical protein Csa_003764 [Cucumis sativus]
MEEESAELVGGIMMKAAIGDLSISRITGTQLSHLLHHNIWRCVVESESAELFSCFLRSPGLVLCFCSFYCVPFSGIGPFQPHFVCLSEGAPQLNTEDP